jgi:hypothetical protein
MVRRISLGLAVLALVMFLLPWVAVTCAGQEIVNVTGLELVTGFEYEAADMTEQADPEVLAILALVASVLLAVAFFLRGKSGPVIRGILCALGVVFLIALKFKLDGDIEKESQGMFQTSYLPGFWIALVSFVATAIMNFLNITGLRKQS